MQTHKIHKDKSLVLVDVIDLAKEGAINQKFSLLVYSNYQVLII